MEEIAGTLSDIELSGDQVESIYDIDLLYGCLKR